MSYELKTGEPRWLVDGLSALACTKPVLGNGRLYQGAWCPGRFDAPWSPRYTIKMETTKSTRKISI
jgi:hypothetical protein